MDSFSVPDNYTISKVWGVHMLRGETLGLPRMVRWVMNMLSMTYSDVKQWWGHGDKTTELTHLSFLRCVCIFALGLEHVGG